MLYCPNSTTATQSYNGNDTTGTAGGSPWCQCPNCGGWHDCVYLYAVREPEFVLASPEAGIEERIIQRPAWWNPKNDIAPRQHRVFHRSGFDRMGRELRHRGGFRNFHKMGD